MAMTKSGHGIAGSGFVRKLWDLRGSIWNHQPTGQDMSSQPTQCDPPWCECEAWSKWFWSNRALENPFRMIQNNSAHYRIKCKGGFAIAMFDPKICLKQLHSIKKKWKSRTGFSVRHEIATCGLAGRAVARTMCHPSRAAGTWNFSKSLACKTNPNQQGLFGPWTWCYHESWLQKQPHTQPSSLPRHWQAHVPSSRKNNDLPLTSRVAKNIYGGVLKWGYPPIIQFHLIVPL